MWWTAQQLALTLLLSYLFSAILPNISSVHVGCECWKQGEQPFLSILSYLLLSVSYSCPCRIGIQYNRKFLQDYSPWTKSIPALVHHPDPHSVAFRLKVLHFTPKNDNLTLTLANRSTKLSPLEATSLMQLPCWDLIPCNNVSNKCNALTLKCYLSN